MRFGRINAELNRDEVVRELCVLDRGVAMYMVQVNASNIIEADFMRDRQKRLVMGIYDRNQTMPSSSYSSTRWGTSHAQSCRFTSCIGVTGISMLHLTWCRGITRSLIPKFISRASDL